MKKNIARSILGAILVLSFVGKPVEVLVQGLEGLRTDPSANASISESLEAPARIIFRDNKKDIIIFLTKKRNAPVRPESVFLQGKVSYRGREYPVAASVIDGKTKLTFPSRPRGSAAQRLNTLTITKNGTGRLASVPVSVAHARSCGSTHEDSSESPPKVMALNEGLPSNLSHVVTLHTYADQEWLAKYGTYANEEIVNIVNTAEAIYTRQLGIRFRIVGQNNYFTAETDPLNILRSFQADSATQNNTTDIKHLFTAKDMASTVIGIAYTGTMCVYPDWTYGVTQDYYTYTPYVFAHEIGHNFNARHTYSGLMAPTIGYQSANGFSEESITQINSHLGYFGSCLSLEREVPNLAQATLTIAYKNKTVTGKLTSRTGAPIPGAIIHVTIDRRRKFARTNTTGTYKIKVTSKGRHVASASTQGGEKTTRVIRFTIR